MQGSSRVVKEIGSATKDTDMTFVYKLKNPGKKLDIEKIPFQVRNLYGFLRLEKLIIAAQHTCCSIRFFNVLHLVTFWKTK